MSRREFELIQIALGKIDKFSIEPTEQDWESLFMFAEKQAIAGVLAYVFEKLPAGQSIQEDRQYDWLSVILQNEEENYRVNKRAAELTSIFSKAGYGTCVLKGQGNALYYPNPGSRQSGDIDFWVDAGIEEIVKFVSSLNIKIHDIHYVHATADFFNDVSVEIHFRPSWMYNPFTGRKLEKFFKEQGYIQFQLYDREVGFAHPSLYFNLVYNLVHINRHIFDEGIGLRQIMDYYYILEKSSSAVRSQAMTQLCNLKLSRFTAALMYVMQKVFGLNDSLLLCLPNKKYGERLLADIMEGGNFGQYGNYKRTSANDQRIERGFANMKRNIQFLTSYPEEVLWIPFFKLWHWCWRKWRGYF